MLGSAFAPEAEQQPPGANEPHVPVAQRGQAVAVIGPRILGVANADARRIEQAHYDGKHLVARQTGLREIAPDERDSRS